MMVDKSNIDTGRHTEKGSRLFRFSMQTTLLFFILVLIQFACASPAKIIRESSSPVAPKWIKSQPGAEDVLYFLGISTSAETLEQGQESALKNAMAEISNYMGTRVESKFQSYITEIERDLSFQMKSESAAYVKGAKVVDSYYQKIIRIDKRFRMERYDVYLLVSLSLEQVQKEMDRQEKEKREKVNSAKKFYLSGLQYEKSRDFQNALCCFEQAIDLIAPIHGIVAIDDQKIKNSEELYFLLKNHKQFILSQLSTISIFVNVKGTERGETVFISNFMFSMGEHDFTITAEKPAYTVIGDVSTMESSYVMNNYVYYAEGTVSARRMSDNQIVATYSFKTKGFHRKKERSELNALKEAGIEAGNALAEMMLIKNEKK